MQIVSTAETFNLAYCTRHFLNYRVKVNEKKTTKINEISFKNQNHENLSNFDYFFKIS